MMRMIRTAKMTKMTVWSMRYWVSMVGIRLTSSVPVAGANGRVKILPTSAQLPIPVAAIIMGFITLPMKGRYPRMAMKMPNATVHLRICHMSHRCLVSGGGGFGIGVACSRSVSG